MVIRIGLAVVREYWNSRVFVRSGLGLTAFGCSHFSRDSCHMIRVKRLHQFSCEVRGEVELMRCCGVCFCTSTVSRAERTSTVDPSNEATIESCSKHSSFESGQR